MFTGIVEELGVVESLDWRAGGARLRVQCRTVLEDAAPGSSIAVNGVCLTAVEAGTAHFASDLAPETLSRSNLGDLRTGSIVNLERPVTPVTRLSGHIVQGHVDGTGAVVSLAALGDGNWWLKLRVPEELDRYLVFKGSVAVDGISLTIASIGGGELSAAIIPHTYRNTTVRAYQPGTRVNLECDVLAKHVEKLLGRS